MVAVSACLAVALVALVAALFVLRSQADVSGRLRRQRDAIETEEHRMFDFLHGLSEALSGDAATERASLHRTIVRGAAMVVDAHGSAIYLLDKAGERLVPQYQSEACPPLIPVPPHIAKQAKKTPTTLDSYRRLTSVGRDWGPFGEALKTGRLLRVDNLGAHPSFERADPAIHRGVSAMIAPLIYGNKQLGVLAVANASLAERFTENDFDVFRSVAEQSAFTLGNAIVHTEAAEKRRLDQELSTASEVQRILLPEKAPELEGFRIAGANVPAKTVSGDYFDYFDIGDGRLGVVIADVSGKGVPASLITAMCRSVVRASAGAGDSGSPAAILASANQQLFPDIREDMFISLAFAILHAGDGVVRLARAGHDPPLHYSADGNTVFPVESPGIAIGIDAGDVFTKATRDHDLELATGDILLFYTDGVNEATDPRGEEFGLDRLHAALVSAAPKGAEAVVASILHAVERFAGTVAQNDDITLIAVEKR